MAFEYEFADGWIVRDRDGYRPDDETSKATVFALANGYMSSRGAPESAPLDAPGVVGHYINGLYDTPSGGILDREIINLPAWTPIRLRVDGHTLDLTRADQVEYVRALHLHEGVMRQSVRWTLDGGKTITLDSERLVSMARLHLGAIQWRIQADADCEVQITSALDARVNNRFAPTHFAAVAVEAGAVSITTIEKGWQVVVAAAHELVIPPVSQPREEARVIHNRLAFDRHQEEVWSFRLAAGQSVTFAKYAAVYDSRFSPGDLRARCREELSAAQAAGYAAIRAEHVARWADLWADSDLVIEGDEQAQVAMRFCLFHLLVNAPHADEVSISARGLQGQDYWGSIFWDCDIYVLPFFTTTQPDYARRCVLYRYHTLNGARRKAHGLGFRGAYFAWQSQETGDETCALYVFDDPRTGQKIRSYFADEQIHISADVVYALRQYVQATNDRSLLAQYGLEIACEVARFFASRATYNAALDRYELRTVLGPDEYHERVDNDAYTNALARLSLETALDMLDRVRDHDAAAYERVRAQIALSDEEIGTWRAMIARFYVPAPDPNTQVIEQFDGYLALEDASPDVVRARLEHPDQYPGGLTGPYQSTQVIKQADVVLLLYLLRDHYSQAVKEANWHYYEPRTAHDSSLSPMAYALVAADVGMVDWAYRYFLHTATMDLLGTGPHWNLGVHTAAMGGAWLAVVHGFCRLDVRDEGVILRAWPALPDHWQRVSLTLIWRGYRVRFTTGGRRVSFEAASGAIPVHYPGGQAIVGPGRTLELEF